MAYTTSQLKDKILEFHPEILQKGIDLAITFDALENRYVLAFRQAGQELGLFLAKSDADACLEGKKCMNLAIQVAQLLVELADLVSPRKPG